MVKRHGDDWYNVAITIQKDAYFPDMNIRIITLSHGAPSTNME